MKTILFVCTGNTCRSPMAEAMARQLAAAGELPAPDGSDGWLFASAGVAAAHGAPVSPETLDALAARGIEHRGASKALTPRMIENADLVLTLTRPHAGAAAALLPPDSPHAAKIHPLDPDGDIEDPFGRGPRAYEHLAETLTTLLPGRLRELLMDTSTDTADASPDTRIAIACDHRGVEATKTLLEPLRHAGYVPEVLGQCDGESCDYPDQAWLVGRAVADGEAARGVLVCGSGVGMCIAANKIDGVRAVLAFDETVAEMSRRHNNTNVLCLSADMTNAKARAAILEAWLSAPFEGGRHARRVDKIAAIEAGRNPAEADVEQATG